MTSPPATPLRFATWNVNSVRARTDRLVAWLARSDVDVLALQETKVPNDKFPYQAVHDLGFEVAHHGTSQWNGVALISRVGLDDVERGFAGAPGFRGANGTADQASPAGAEAALVDVSAVASEGTSVEARAIGATCGGVRIWSLYVPHGRAVGDPHYHYKLAWLAALRAEGKRWLAADPAAQIALCGDFNIAPTDADVWDRAFFEGSTHVTEPERDAFQQLTESGFSDVVRPYTAEPRTFTYWDYQQLRFQKKQGMRIDFALCSPALAARVVDATIDRDERKGKGASDHAPVIVELR